MTKMEKKLNSKWQCISLFWEFFKIGLFTIGGGMAMIPQFQHVVVNEKSWLKDEEMVDCVAVSQALPGVIAINTATYIGMKLKGFKGALAATLGVITPSFIIIILAVTALDFIGENSYVQGAFIGIKAAVSGLIIVTVVRIGRKILGTVFSWVLVIVAFATIVIFNVNAIWLILAGAVAGVLYSLIKSGKKQNSEEPQGEPLHEEEVDE